MVFYCSLDLRKVFSCDWRLQSFYNWEVDFASDTQSIHAWLSPVHVLYFIYSYYINLFQNYRLYYIHSVIHIDLYLNCFVFQWFWEIVKGYDKKELAILLQFATGR